MKNLIDALSEVHGSSRESLQKYNMFRSLFDFASDDSGYKFIMQTQSHFTNFVRLVNLFLHHLKQDDSCVNLKFTENDLKSGVEKGFIISYDEFVLEADLKDILGKSYFDKKEILWDPQEDNVLKVEEESEKSSSSVTSFISKGLSQNFEDSDEAFSQSSEDSINLFSEDYWSKAVSLDFPMYPNFDPTDVRIEFSYHGVNYKLYGESRKPRTQSEITMFSDPHVFSDGEILNLFPNIRLYTRSPYMYKKYSNVPYDDDLGVIFKISGYTKAQVKRNIIEFPYLENLDRIVKIKGKETTIPFWRNIEIDGEICSTIDVWDKLPDTKKLPKTESFMNEYVTRKYILDVQHGVKKSYPMRGTLESFLVLYNKPEYYEKLKYDPIMIGKKCIVSRKSYKESRNPVMRMYREYESNIELQHA